MKVEGFYVEKFNKRNINEVLKNYSLSSENPRHEVEFYGRLIHYSHKPRVTVILYGSGHDIRCHVKKESYEKFKGLIYRMHVINEDEKDTYVVMKGIPYFNGNFLELCVKQAEILWLTQE